MSEQYMFTEKLEALRLWAKSERHLMDRAEIGPEGMALSKRGLAVAQDIEQDYAHYIPVLITKALGAAAHLDERGDYGDRARAYDLRVALAHFEKAP